MKFRSIIFVLSLLAVGIIITGVAIGQEGQVPEPNAPEAVDVSSAFTYQGQLKDGGSLVNGECDFKFELYNAVTGGSKIGSTLTKSNVNVVDGRFTVALNFGGSAFTGSNRWLLIKVRCPAGSGSYTTLTPRQQLRATPYALYSNNAGALDGLDSSAFAPANLAKQASKFSQSISSSTFVEVLKVNVSLPDRCTGGTPVAHWNVLVTAGGSVYTSTAGAYSEATLSIDSTTSDIVGSRSLNTMGPGDDFITSYGMEWLLTNVSSGSHDFRLMDRDVASITHTNHMPRLIVQPLGYTCAASLTSFENQNMEGSEGLTPLPED